MERKERKKKKKGRNKKKKQEKKKEEKERKEVIQRKKRKKGRRKRRGLLIVYNMRMEQIVVRMYQQKSYTKKPFSLPIIYNNNICTYSNNPPSLSLLDIVSPLSLKIAKGDNPGNGGTSAEVRSN